MQKRRLIAIAVAVLLILGLFAGCAPPPTGAPPPPPPPPPPAADAGAAGDAADDEVDLSQFRVVFTQDRLDQIWRAYQAESVRVMGEAYGMNIEIIDGMGSAEGQIAAIEDVVAAGVDLLIVSPFQEAALSPTIAAVYAQGIPVILIDRGMTTDGFTSYISADNVLIGKMIADFIADAMMERHGEIRGNIAILDGVPGATSTVQRNEGFRARLQEYPGLVVIADQPAHFRRDTAMSVMEDFLVTHDNIDVVFTLADESTMGAIMAIEAAGRRDEILIVSVNGTMEGIEAIINGRLDLTILYTNAAGPGVEFAVKYLRGEPIPRRVIIDPIAIDITNAHEFFVEGRYSPDPMRLAESDYEIFWEWSP